MRRHYRTPSPEARAARKVAEAEARGEPVRTEEDFRRPCLLDLRGAGGPMLTLEPVRGKIAWKARDDSGKVVARAAIKALLHSVASSMDRVQSFRSL